MLAQDGIRGLVLSLGLEDVYTCQILLYPAEIGEISQAAAEACAVPGMDWESFGERDAPDIIFPQAGPDDIAYLQYSSGSTRFPHGVILPLILI